MTIRVLRVLAPALLLSSTWSASAWAEMCVGSVDEFNTFMSGAGGASTTVTVTFNVTGVKPPDFAGSKGCLAELLDTSCATGASATLKVYGPYDPPSASHPAGTLKFEYGNQCCPVAPCQTEEWADPNASATVFVDGTETCAVKIWLDPLHVGYHLDCNGTLFDAVGDNVDKNVVTQLATLQRVDGGWAMPNAVASSTKVCFEPPMAAPGVLTMDIPVLEDVTASASAPGVYPVVQELGLEAGDSQAFLKFDLGAVPGHVTKAKLFLHQSDVASADGDGGDAFVVLDHGWSENTLTWASRPATAGVSLARVSPVAAFSWYSWDVSTAVAKPAIYAFALQPEASDANGAHFFSKEGSATLGPYMRVEYVVTDADADGYPDGPDCNDSAPAVHPGAPELCNGIDDNCDGAVDNNIPQVGKPCTAMGFLGICQFGTYECPAAPPIQLTCNHPLPGTIQETCNGKDDDCNGTIDDPGQVNGQPCDTGLPGVCKAGTSQCINSSLKCNSIVGPSAELCDNVDNNCDGTVDNLVNATATCSAQLPGAMNVGAWACTSGACQIQSCNAGSANIDGASANGCECTTDLYATTCGAASTLAVSLLTTNVNPVVMSGKIETASGSDFLIFSFELPPLGTPWHPQISLTSNPGNEYAMDIMSSCAANYTCAAENGANVNSWELNYAYGSAPTDTLGKVQTAIVRIYRKNGDAPTCDLYVVHAINP